MCILINQPDEELEGAKGSDDSKSAAPGSNEGTDDGPTDPSIYLTLEPLGSMSLEDAIGGYEDIRQKVLETLKQSVPKEAVETVEKSLTLE